MARRSHLTPVGWIAAEDLDEVGAGKIEGWLSDPSLLAAIQTPYLVIARRTIAIIVRWDDRRRDSVKIRPTLAPSEEITAVEWIPIGEILAVALGTSAGLLFLYSTDGDLILKQIVYTARLVRLRFREVESQSFGGDSSYDLCAVASGVIARFDGSDIKSFLQRWSGESRSLNDIDHTNSQMKIPYQLWNITKFGICADAAITGMMPPPLLELPSQERYYCAVAAGDDAVISAYRLSEDRRRSLVGAILSKVVPTAVSTLSSFSKVIWRREETSKPKIQPFAKASHLTCLKDHPRKGEKITLSPRGTLAAIADSLGRILLLDTQALVVVRLWKGYREASCLFMEAHVARDEGPSTSSNARQIKREKCLCLVIHAPKKGILEVWKMRTGPRLLTVKCPRGCKILQPPTRLDSPLEVFLWNGDSGQLSLLNTLIT
ncbi:rab3 GTPase-activating protein non-catalytic subunit [Wolffia australiana]